ncbi:hypothetical protein ACOSQ2_025128 [Xanthoceras sorbifolium]
MQDGSGLADSAEAGVYGDQNGSLDDQLTERGNNLIVGEELVSKQSCESKGKQWITLCGVSPCMRDMASFEEGLLFSKAADLVFKKPQRDTEKENNMSMDHLVATEVLLNISLMVGDAGTVAGQIVAGGRRWK